MFRAHAKILLFGEYLMLDGYLGLAIPLRHDQTLTVEPCKEKGIHVYSYSLDGITYQDETWSSKKSSLFHKSLTWLSHEGYIPKGNWRLTTQLSYPQNRGLESNSTFLDLLAQRTGCDLFALCRVINSGSNYDIICTRQTEPLLYDPLTMESQSIEIKSLLLASMYFVPCEQKQLEDNTIVQYRSCAHQGPDQYDRCEFLDGLLHEQTVQGWHEGMTYHDEIITALIKKPSLMTTHPWISEIGYGKWLRTWAGNCFLIISDYHYDVVNAACHAAGYANCIPLQKMIQKYNEDYSSNV